MQHDRFIEEISKLPLSLSSSMKLSEKFGSSVHAALRNYVAKSKNKCALLVLTPIKESLGNGAVCETRNLFYSDSFLAEIGELNLPKEFGFKWSFIQDFRFKKKFKENGEITLKTLNNEEVNLTYHYFNNTYNVFVFLFPKGEKNKTRTKIIVRNS